MNIKWVIQMFHCKIAYPPTINHYYIHNKHNNKKFINGDVRRYICINQSVIKCKMASTLTVTMLENIDLFIYAYPPDNRIRDKDNILKCIFDTIKIAGIIKDDSQIKNLAVYDGEVKKEGACVIFFILPHTPVTMPDEYYNNYFS